jgi:cob(I)alamin adenosyltransferase
MGNRLTKVYTRTGDQGSTGLADGSRRSKNDPRVHCMGEVDELNACLGLALSLLDDGPLQQLLFSVQHDLFDVGAELCQPGKQLITSTPGSTNSGNLSSLAARKRWPACISRAPSAVASSLHLARTVCRRVERGLVTLGENEIVNPVTSRYINRLSDLLFILARAQSQSEDGGEVYWNSKYSRLNRASD